MYRKGTVKYISKRKINMWQHLKKVHFSGKRYLKDLTLKRSQQKKKIKSREIYKY